MPHEGISDAGVSLCTIELQESTEPERDPRTDHGGAGRPSSHQSDRAPSGIASRSTHALEQLVLASEAVAHNVEEGAHPRRFLEIGVRNNP